MPANNLRLERMIGTQDQKTSCQALPPAVSVRLRAGSMEPEFTRMFFADLVVIARVPEPDPIPNSTVKTLCADGTKSQGLGE